jgi:LysR family carnitine catabolism transcriptional activator
LCVGQMRELGARCITLRDPVVERAIGVLTKPGVELSAAAQALFDILREPPLTLTLPKRRTAPEGRGD